MVIYKLSALADATHTCRMVHIQQPYSDAPLLNLNITWRFRIRVYSTGGRLLYVEQLAYNLV